MPLILRSVLGTKLSITQMDGNLTYLVGTLSGSVIQVTGSSFSAPSTAITASVVSASFTGSLFGTASWALNAQSAINTSADLQQITDNGNVTSNDIDTQGSLGLYDAPNALYNRIYGVENGISMYNSGNKLMFEVNGTGGGGTIKLYDQNLSGSVIARPPGPITLITLPSVSGQLMLTSQTASWAVSASQAISASRATTSSFAISASWAPSVASNPFPFTGSAIISGSLGVTGSVAIGNGDITITPSSATTKITITDGFMKNQMTKTSTEIINQASPNNFSIGTYIYDPTNSPFFPLSNAIYSGGTTDLLISSQQKLNIEATSTEITGSLKVTGSTSLNGLMTLQPINPLPSVVNGSIAYSSSGDFYFGSGSAWRKLTL